MRKVFIEGNKI